MLLLGKMTVELEKITLHRILQFYAAIAVNLLGKEKSVKVGLKNKQFLAAMDNKYERESFSAS